MSYTLDLFVRSVNVSHALMRPRDETSSPKRSDYPNERPVGGELPVAPQRRLTEPITAVI
jgi:hypothetical protein